MQVDVVVVAFESRDVLRDCVAPLAGADGIHVVVVDNASTDGSAAVVADLPVTTIVRSENGGFAVGCNTGWKAGAAPYVLFLNPDARIAPEGVRALAARLESDGAIGIAGPRMENERGDLELSIRRHPRLVSTYAQALLLHRLLPRASWVDEVVRDPSAYERAHRVEWVSGACMLVRRSVLERLGGFDERFFMYCEDADLCRCCSALGHAVTFEPAAGAVHIGGRSAPRSSLLPVLARSRRLYLEKHSSSTAASAATMGIALGALVRSVTSHRGTAAREGHRRALRETVRRRAGGEAA